MRSVPGLDRAGVQWAAIGSCVLLIAVTVSAAFAVRRSSNAIRELNAEIRNLRSDLEQLESRLIREQSTREALALELTRLRVSGRPAGASVPTLTLHAAARRTGEAPEPTVSAPSSEQTIQLRLVLPKSAAVPPDAPIEAVLRDWSSGKTIWSRADLRVTTVEKQPAVLAYVTGDVFSRGAYEVVVRSNAGDIATYEVAVR